MKTRHAIVVSYSINRIAFVIDGFESKQVANELIAQKITDFFERITNLSVDVKELLSGFLVVTKTDTFKVSWSWHTSYVA